MGEFLPILGAVLTSLTTTLGIFIRYRYRRQILRDALEGVKPAERAVIIRALVPILKFELPSRKTNQAREGLPRLGADKPSEPSR